VDPAWPPGEACTVCLGLHTGRILLDSLGEERRLTYTAVGDATQHATGLAQQAAPGTILVSAATAQLVHDEVRLEVCAPVPLPGQSDSGPAYQVLGLGPYRAPLLPDGARPRSRFVGRALELATMQALLTRVEGGQGQVVGLWVSLGWARRGSSLSSASTWGARGSPLSQGSACRTGRRPPMGPCWTSCGTPVV